MDSQEDVGVGVGPHLVFALPAWLWRLYLDHLWNVQPGSWVARTASSFHFLAYLIITPFALLTLLDVMSYIIARTLGVVETTKASTSDLARVPSYFRTSAEEPLSDTDQPADDSEEMRIQVQVAEVSDEIDTERSSGADAADNGEDDSGLDEGRGIESSAAGLTARPRPRFSSIIQMPDALRPDAIITSIQPEACFFSPSDEKDLELSGALLSSPAMSRQGSPILERRRLQPLRDEADANNSATSSDSEPFTIVGKNPEADNTISHPKLRRRGGPQLPGGIDASTS